VSGRADRARAARARLGRPSPALVPESDYFVTRLPDATAEGALDSTRAALKAKRGTHLSHATPKGTIPKKRRRLTGARRKAQKRAEDARFDPNP
jgi:hypothetical protein